MVSLSLEKQFNSMRIQEEIYGSNLVTTLQEKGNLIKQDNLLNKLWIQLIMSRTSVSYLVPTVNFNRK